MRAGAGNAAHLWDMLDAAQAICRFTEGRTLDDYLEDRMLRGAVERHIELISEAANRVSTSFRISHSHIAWRHIVAQRHVLGHGYGELKHDLLWKVATEDIPELVQQLEPLVPPPPMDD